MDKSLKKKAIKIQGKDYVLVSDRVIFFNEEYPNGCIKTNLITDPLSETIVIKAQITPDIEKPNRYFTGYSQEVVGEGFINKTSAMENAETSAVGRALAMMGIGVIDSIASVDEINKAGQREYRQKPSSSIPENGPNSTNEYWVGAEKYHRKTGNKNGKEWVGYFPENEELEPIWGDDQFKLTQNGINLAQKAKESNNQADIDFLNAIENDK